MKEIVDSGGEGEVGGSRALSFRQKKVCLSEEKIQKQRGG